MNFRFTFETVNTFKQERFASTEYTLVKFSKSLFLDSELWFSQFGKFNVVSFMQVVFLFFDSKAAMTKVVTEVCILKWEELTLIAFDSESAPKVFFRSHLY